MKSGILIVVFFIFMSFIYIQTYVLDSKDVVSAEEAVQSYRDVPSDDIDTIRNAVSEALNKGAIEPYIIDPESTEPFVQDENKHASIKVISSNTVELEYDGKTVQARLIGVAPGSDTSGIELLISRMSEDYYIEQDIKKTEKDVMLIYLWDGEPGDVSNLINVQLVKQNYSSSTYEMGSLIVENPNIKYFGEFINAVKARKK